VDADGRRCFTFSNREGKFRIYKQAVGQGTPELLDTGAMCRNILRLNPDRTKVLYSALRDHGANEEPLQHDAKMEAKLAGKDSGSSMPSGGTEFNGVSDHASAIERGVARNPCWNGLKSNNFQCARLPSRECIFSSYANETLEFYEFDSEERKSSLMFKIADSDMVSVQLTLSRGRRITGVGEEAAGTGRSGDSDHVAARRLDAEDRLKQCAACVDCWAADGKSTGRCASPREGEERS